MIILFAGILRLLIFVAFEVLILLIFQCKKV